MIGRKKMSGFPTLMNIDEALRIVLSHLSVRTKCRDIQLEDSLGMVASRDITAPFDVPPFDRSTVEGYAVIAAETTSSTQADPQEFEPVGRSEAGSRPEDLAFVGKGRCMVIFTGGPIPSGANAVVSVEQTKRIGGRVFICKSVAPWQNISRKGEDFSAGELIVKKGTRLKPWHVGALASVNLVTVSVQEEIKIAVLSTGGEVREPGREIEPGGILNSSKPMLKTLIKDRCCIPIDLGTVPDDLSQIGNSILRGLGMADLVLTTGGTSLGEKDFVPEAVCKLGRPGVVVHGVSMRPGKPTGVGFVDGHPIFMLSGNPVAALVGFEVFVDPVINRILGSSPEIKPVIRARLSRKVVSPVGVRSFLRVNLVEDKDGYIAEPLRLTGSGILSSMTKANGILVINECLEGYDEQEEVEVSII
jgi:molybdopterin molybdotransferase